MNKQLKAKIIIGFMMAVVALALFSLVVLQITETVCELSSIEPILDSGEDLPNKATRDNKCLANFAGYLVYNFTDKKIEERFLELELYSIEWTEGDLIQVKMNADCGSIDFSFQKKEDHYEAQEIKLNLFVSSAEYNACYVKNPQLVHFPVDNHYLCRRGIQFDCLSYKDQTLLAFFYLMDIELELDGKPEGIKEYEFTLPTYSCDRGLDDKHD